MSDQDLRALARAWQEGGDDPAGAAYLAARLRSGDLDDERLQLLAELGLGAALARLGDDAPDTVLHGPLRHGLSLGGTWNRVAILLLWERHFLPAWEASHPGDPRGRELLRYHRGVVEGSPAPGAPPADVPDLDPGDAATLERWLYRDPRTPTLQGVLPRAARHLDMAEVARQLRADLAAAALGVALPAGAVRALQRARISLVACEDMPTPLVRDTAAWLDGLSLARPRPLRVSVGEGRPAYGRDLLATSARRLYGDGFTVFVTREPDAQGWFARHLPTAPRVSVVHVGERARARLEAPPDAFLAHMIAKKALDGLLGAQAPRHEPSRGCAFDFCADKVSLDGRIRVGSVCRACHALLTREAGVPPETLAALLAVLAAARDRTLEAR